MEKIKINNQVVLMRKHVKQAKVHAINKLVKEAKLLQNRKGDDGQVAKAKRKAERCLKGINILKKIKPDHVSKLALSKSKDWKDVLQQKTSTLEDRCLAMLANYEAVQKEVGIFHSANPILVPKIPDLVKEWEQKSQFSKDSPNAFGKEKNKFNKSNVRKDKDWLSTFEKTGDKEVSFGNKKKSIIQIESEVSGNKDNRLRFDSKDSTLEDEECKTQEINKNKHPDKQKVKHKSHFIKTENDKIPSTQISQNVEVNKSSADESCSEDVLDSDLDMEEDSNAEESESEMDNSEIMDDDMNDSVNVKATKVGSVKKSESDYDNSEVFQKKLKKNKLSDGKDACVKDIPDDKNCTNSEFSVTDKLDLDYYVKSDNISKESSVKTITRLNLDDFQGLDEIPIYKTSEDEKESDEEKDSGKKVSDPFFLGRDEVAGEDRFIGSARNMRSSFVPKGDSDNLGERNRFGKGEKSNFQNNFKRDFQKLTNSSSFSRREPFKFNDRNELKGERNFNKSRFQSNNQERFQNKDRNKFHSKEPKDFNRKERRSFLASGKKPYEQSKKSHFRSEANSSFSKDKVLNKKGIDGSVKPIHPSWEAKKKQKELAQTAFQGKRMVFNE